MLYFYIYLSRILHLPASSLLWMHVAGTVDLTEIPRIASIIGNIIVQPIIVLPDAVVST